MLLVFPTIAENALGKEMHCLHRDKVGKHLDLKKNHKKLTSRMPRVCYSAGNQLGVSSYVESIHGPSCAY